MRRAKWIDSAGSAEWSVGRRPASEPFGLWQMTQCWVSMRWLPCEKTTLRSWWQTLQFARATLVRRGVTEVPVTAK